MTIYKITVVRWLASESYTPKESLARGFFAYDIGQYSLSPLAPDPR